MAEKNKSITTLEIINGISQAVHNKHSGAIDKDGEPVKIGLRREETIPLKDKAVTDGFGVKIIGNKLIISYSSDMKLEETHDNKFEQKLEEIIADIVKYIKKEYKGHTGKALTLKKGRMSKPLIQTTSRVRIWVEVQCEYEIGGIDDPNTLSDETYEKRQASTKKWFEMSKEPKKSENVEKSSEKDDYEQFDPTNLKSGRRN